MTEEDNSSGSEVTSDNVVRSLADAQPVETYQQRVNKQLRREIEEADQEWIRKQKLLDHLWQMKLDAEAPLHDDYVEIGGFRERRSAMPSFHKSQRDRDW